ncbi:hypothetical protein EDD80_1152 [Anseongella ginsenosidimutans]|uniref:Uncharacterized protein n=1 Tax=Anseongella ginsenosidimutans TaxID=496056 RepID=A0A4R3KLK5_9SPHI|nr:hypothetical protein [Anseongella ginsenosidimutans]QEC51946.1 hypothetical protein FRZ59_06105 [Anseongella ginsenosidimutans]TCS85019.1 hypothetical protein EDD80_1152 [Anseongella ginsenosidimutans]
MKTELECLNFLKESFSINGGGLFNRLLKERKNHHFISQMVGNVERAYFEPDNETINWSDHYIVNLDKNRDGYKYVEFIIDVKVNGDIKEFNEQGIDFHSKPVSLAFTIQVPVWTDFGSFDYQRITLLNEEQKALLLYHRQYEKELDSINGKLLFQYRYDGDDAYSFFTRIWKTTDNSSAVMTKDTGYDFFQEIVECHRNILFSVGNLNMWGRYKSHYSESAYYFEGKKQHPIELCNNDFRYLYFMENAIEELYTFYEKVTYLLSNFLNPSTGKHHPPSFANLFGEKNIERLEKKFPHITEEKHFKWFLKRKYEEHQELQAYRHSLVHFQTDAPFITGTYVATFSRLWRESSDKAEELKELFNKFEKIQEFVNKELEACKEIFKNMVLLIENLPKTTGHTPS